MTLTILVVGLLCTSAVAQSNAGRAASQTTTSGIDHTDDTPAATPQSDMSANDDESGKTQQQPVEMQQSDSTAAASQPTMSAEQIVAILQQQPDLLASFKEAAAQQLGVDPNTISDDALYSRIQQDANARVQATKELNRLGYSTNQPATSTRSAEKGGQAARTTSMGKSQTRRPAPDDTQAEPKRIQQPDPYGDLVSVHDLYTQIPSSGGHLRRFGSDAFIVGSGNANELPTDLPVGPDYVLGPGDMLVVHMWGGRSESLSLTIDRQGQIALPQAGTITLNSLTIGQAQDAIQKALSTQFRDEHVEISLGRLRTVRVYVVGDVQRPGAYDVSSLSTPLSALYAAGGPTSRGSLRVLRQYRDRQLVKEIDLYDLLLRGVHSDTDRLLPGDTILVPPVGPQVTVEGMVHRPAIYELNGEQGLDDVLDLAGGVVVTANLKQINVERVEAHQRRTMISLELPDSPDSMRQKLASFHVQDGDDVVISQILPYNQQAVYLEGHVFRPGKYPYRDGMTISDLLHSYQDVMPEPSDHVELVRLQSPDYRPETVTLRLSDILMGNNSMLLQPFDLVRVYGRYEVDSPKVRVEGEVLRPGEYPMSQGMTAAGLVDVAGGFRRSAYRDTADLSSYVIQNGQEVLVNHETVDMKKVFEGDKTADVVLKPGDVVSIRQLAGWQDIGSSVTIEGEVEHAGSYGIDQGERLSSVLKRAGGFRQSAYPAAAILERVQVRELAEQGRQEMIRRLETTPLDIKAGVLSVQEQAGLQQSLEQQRQQTLTALRNHAASGRQVISISSDISSWQNTSADIELRAGDRLVIPKRPTFVMVTGQVYNATAITYVQGRDVSWYLNKAGGATPSGNKKDIYVLRADGSIVVSGNSWFNGSFMKMRLRPGDTVIVPEKLIGGSQVWRNIIATAQIASSVALTGAVAGIY
jgi:protein involved in polysaccharide export with SLBB domain